MESEMALTSSEVLASLDGVSSPEGLPLPKTGVLSDILVADGKVFFSITVNAAVVQAWEPVRKRAEAAVKVIPGVTSVMVALTAERKAAAAAPPQQRPAAAPQGRHAGPGAARAQGPTSVEGVGAIIAVASGKGGVGKSTTAVNLALGLAANGVATGLLDADIYGPSLPRMIGLNRKPDVRDDKMIPLQAWGLSCMSIGFLVDEETPMIWRGPMVMGALEQMMGQVAWGKLDILVVDMPPGTGDAQLTMAQRVALTGAVIVSTPQDIALLDARRGVRMFEKTQVPVLGLVENMSFFNCPSCGHVSHIFGHGGARQEAQRLGTEFLGEVPLLLDIRMGSDSGTPVAAAAPESEAGKAFAALAARVWEKVAGADVSRSSGPKIVIE
jgi:ATP-binding protein involved in chromosome partitioning